MANSAYVTLDSVTFKLPDGRALFSNLSHVFDQRCTGIAGRNGIGKTVLARLLTGEWQAAAGRILRPPVHYVGQHADAEHQRTVADLMQLATVLDALRRIEAGSCLERDFALVGERWALRQELEARLADSGLPSVHADTPTAMLSGGEATRVALLGAFMSEAEVLILDEPTNHLDSEQRRRLYEHIAQWPRQLIVISHDRQLLRHMACIVELSERGLRSYGGNYDFYAHTRTLEHRAALAELEHARTQQRKWQQEIRAQENSQRHREAQGKRAARTLNQAPILIGAQAARNQHTHARLERQRIAKSAPLQDRLLAARQKLDAQRDVHLLLPDTAVHSRKIILTVSDLILPFGGAKSHAISFDLMGPERVGVIAPNGFGKSTLLKVIAGQLAPVSGSCVVDVPMDYLDQHTRVLDPQRSAAANLQRYHPLMDEAEARTRLALLGISGMHALQPSGELSGGERLITALSCILYAQHPAQLLLLDEPTNHLDLAAMQAVTDMLNQYHGALLVVSHDADFLDALQLGSTLVCGDDFRLLKKQTPTGSHR